MDFVAAFVDDGTEKGKVVVGLGKTEDGSNNNQLWYYDPEKDTYNLLPEMIPAVEKAKAITIDGAAYIAGGCDSNGGTTGVYKVSFANGTPNVELFANLKVGRCNHALADISDVEIDENGVKTVTPKFAVVGGSIDSKKEGAETPVTGENFIEIVSAGKVEPLSFSSRNGGDDSNLMKTGIIAPSATAITMDDREESEIVIVVAGGYLRDGEAEDEYNWVANPSLIVFSKNAAATKKITKRMRLIQVMMIRLIQILLTLAMMIRQIPAMQILLTQATPSRPIRVILSRQIQATPIRSIQVILNRLIPVTQVIRLLPLQKQLGSMM